MQAAKRVLLENPLDMIHLAVELTQEYHNGFTELDIVRPLNNSDSTSQRSPRNYLVLESFDFQLAVSAPSCFKHSVGTVRIG